MAVKVDIVKEREGLIEEAKRLRQLIQDEWDEMGWQVAAERGAKLHQAEDRIRAIDRAIARRKRT